MDKTSMDYWFPLIESAGIPVPKTLRVEMPPELQRGILMVLYGEKPEIDPMESPFWSELKSAVEKIGTPCFIRTENTSAKHSWEDSCFLADPSDLVKHVYAIAEFSEIADMCGLSFGSWYIRELLPTVPYGHCPRYGNFPVAKEFRFFVSDGKVSCFHPYWPLEPLQDGGWNPDAPEDVAFSELSSLPEGCELHALAETVGRAVPGSWSIDILETERGWFVTDMAEAHRSFHWEGCVEK